LFSLAALAKGAILADVSSKTDIARLASRSDSYHLLASHPQAMTRSIAQRAASTYFMELSLDQSPPLQTCSFVADRRFGVSHLQHPETSHPNSLGRPLPGFACKTRNTKREQTGQILVRAPFNMPAKANANPSAWFRLEQNGFTESGFLYTN
jgi:hypothetical protein